MGNVDNRSYGRGNFGGSGEKVSKNNISFKLRSLPSVEDKEDYRTIAVYQQREKWLRYAEVDSPVLLVTKI